MQWPVTTWHHVRILLGFALAAVAAGTALPWVDWRAMRDDEVTASGSVALSASGDLVLLWVLLGGAVGALLLAAPRMGRWATVAACLGLAVTTLGLETMIDPVLAQEAIERAMDASPRDEAAIRQGWNYETALVSFPPLVYLPLLVAAVLAWLQRPRPGGGPLPCLPDERSG